MDSASKNACHCYSAGLKTQIVVTAWDTSSCLTWLYLAMGHLGWVGSLLASVHALALRSWP